MEIIELEKLCLSAAAMRAAYRFGLPLQDAGWMLYPPACWDRPALAAMIGDQCVGAINYREDREDAMSHVSVDFAFVDPEYPTALTALLARFRAKYRCSDLGHISFTCHAGNEQMAKAVRILAPDLHSLTYRLPIARLARRA